MKRNQTLSKTAVIGAVLWGTVLGSSALTLGRQRGPVLIGQALDIAVPVRLDPGDEPGAVCADADIFHGDTRIDSNKIRVVFESGIPSQDAVIRIRSSAIVDEPVVTVYLKIGCQQRSTRRYVLLADMVSEAALPSMATSGSGAAASAPVVSAPRASPLASSVQAVLTPLVANTSSAAVRSRAAEKKAAVASVPRATETERAVLDKVPPRQGSKKTKPSSRLKLDPVDLLAERDPTLRLSAELLTAPAEDAQKRASAVALWRALNAQPQDILRDAARLEGVESELKTLKQAATRDQAGIAALKSQLTKAESERYANGLVYGLLGLLAALTGLCFFFWRRRGDQIGERSDWWRRSGHVRANDDDLEHSPAVQPASPRSLMPKLTEVDVDLDIDESMFDSLKPPVSLKTPGAPIQPSVAHADFASSVNGPARAVNVEELFDIQQQADFFVSLGQFDQAIEVLKNHISENVETSALAYLDLLKIYHTIKRQDEYEKLRADFNRVFNAEVPDFRAFAEESAGLEAYGAAMSRIEALWPSSRVLDVIEESIFRKPGVQSGEAFGVEAYRELLLLYAIAKDVVERPSEFMDFEISGNSQSADVEYSHSQPSFFPTSINPLSATPHQSTVSFDHTPDLAMSKGLSKLGLDIDLTDELLQDEPSSLPPIPDLVASSEQAADIDVFEMADDAEMTIPALPVLPEPPAEVPAAVEVDSNLLDFDLFDEATESEIAPKPARL